ncbi:early nodulin-like protein 9 [Ziziphus jujuba]|uniref:Early nodulin-like protein 9 n=1 Tax=Ziziphus jujuba TaxID=326968 RepID=A0ABM3I9K7_ZIZJJ|nr:early nodulin-like protein 9 [Ziziphus jujuba]
MAHKVVTSNYQNKAICLLGLLVLTPSMMQTSDATQFPVGGTGIWSPKSTNYTHWAEENIFTVEDSIAFNYIAGQDSVLLVNKGDYTNCSTGSPIGKFTKPVTVIKFNNLGPYYFISGKKDHCLKNQKFKVVVTAYTNQTLPPPPPNGSSAVFVSFIKYMGAFAASSLLLAF